NKEIYEVKIVNKERRIFAKNTIFSYLFSYSDFTFSIFTSLLISRIVSQTIWGMLILSLSYISIFSLPLVFLPPSLGLSVNYFIPKYRALENNGKLRSFILKSLILRVIFVIPIFIISILIFSIFLGFFKLFVNQYWYLFFVLSPLILIYGLDKIIRNMLRALNLFNVVYYLLILTNIIYIGGLIFSFLFVNFHNVETIAIIVLLSNLIPFLFSFIYLLVYINIKYDKIDEKKISYKQLVKELYTYGSGLSINTYINGFVKEAKVQLIALFDSDIFVTGYYIGLKYANISAETIRSLNFPLTNTFTGLYVKKEHEEIEKVYNLMFRYTLFLLLLVTGGLFFLSDFFLSFIYGHNYLIYSFILKLLLLAITFNLLGSFFNSMIRATNKIKYIIPYTILTTIVSLPLYLIGLILNGIGGALLGLVLGNFINFIITIILNKILFKIEIKQSKVTMQYTIFFITILLVYTLDFLFLKDFNNHLLSLLNLNLFQNFNIFSISLFFILYLGCNIIFKVISKEDVENIEIFFQKNNKRNRIILTFLRYLKKLLRK
ncbi:MAG: hypothetical protein P8Y70_11470, partial [Candidatus Lokiarchaeota archaeon]